MGKNVPVKNGIKRGLLMALLLAVITLQSSFAQSRSITGKVNDTSGPLPGVSILVKGTTTATTSDASGSFSINVSANATLVFSFIGYATQEIVVGNQSSLNVTMSDDTQSLDEVVVIGYGTQRRGDVTGAISSISAESIEKTPIANISQAIQGKAAGVQVVNADGAPGGGVTVRIRGVGGFGDNAPLYVVDGYPVTGGIEDINPNDIASMDILKDASATAIYGNRASNGVVIITTKRGKQGQMQVSFNALTSVQAKPKTYDMLNAQEFVGFANEILAQAGDYQAVPEWTNPSSLRTIDWQDVMYRNGLRQDYNVAFRGGNETVQSAISLGYYNQTGIVKYSDFNRFNASANVDYKPKTWLKASTNIKYTRRGGSVGLGSGQNGLGGVVRAIPTMTGNPLTNEVKDAAGNYGYYTKNSDVTATQRNYFADLETQDQRNDHNSLLANAFLEATIIPGLKFKTDFGINTRDYSGYYFTPSHNRSTTPTLSYYNQSANNSFEWKWENTVSYNQTFGIHSIDFIGGISAQENRYRSMAINGTGSISDELRSGTSMLQQKITDAQGNVPWSLASQFARLTYQLDNKYIVTGTVRRDGSSRFGPNEKWGVFPSFSAKWKMKEEAFLADVDAISDLSIRAGWGKAGNQNIGLFRYQGNYGSGPSASDNRGYVFGGSYQEGIVLNGLPNPHLTWEKQTTSNIALDAAFFNNKVNLTVDYFNKISSDFLLDVDVPANTGFTSATRNVGSIENKGVEIALEYRESQNEFNWGISGNVSFIKNKIVSFTDGLTALTNFDNLGFPEFGGNTWLVFSRSAIGGQVGDFYGFKSDGIFQTQAEVDALNASATAKSSDPTQNTYYQTSGTSAGDRRFVDINGDGKITDADRTNLGSPLPKFFGGLNFDASYKQFDFNMFFNGSFGNKIFNYAKRNLESFATNGGVGIQNVSREYYENRWTPTNPSNTYTRAIREETGIGNTRPSDAYVENGSYVRLKNVQLGYTLPTSLVEKATFSKVRLYVSAQNIFTITKYSGLDPEIGEQAGVTASGLDVGTYPQSTFFTFGLQAQF